MMRKYHGNFESLSFPKTGVQIRTQVQKMIREMETKIRDREKRIQDLAKKMNLGSSMDVLLNMESLRPSSPSFSNTYGEGPDGVQITVGNSASIRDEIQARKSEMMDLEKLRSIHRNLPPKKTFNLSFEELRYFGF